MGPEENENDIGCFPGYEQRAGVGDHPGFDASSLDAMIKQYESEEKERRLKQRVANALTAEVQRAIGCGQSWDTVIALAIAAKHTLLALERGYFSDPAENLMKLAQMQGLGDNSDEGPFPAL